MINKSKTDTKNEFETLFQITFISIFSLLGILLIVVAVYSQWSLWTLPFIALVIASFWVTFIGQVKTARARIFYYVIMALAGIVYYGTKDVSITDVPVIICLLIIILAAYREVRLIYLSAAVYPVLILVHIFILKDLGKDSGQLVFSRLILGGVCLICAVFIARFFLRELERERQVQRKMELELEQARKENERFLANVSHELRTPINAVNGMGDIILQRELDEELRMQVESIRTAGKRLYAQVSDILDYSELMTGKMQVSNEVYEPLSVFNDAVMDVMWQQISDKLEFAIDIEPSIPSVLVGDANKVKKILAELIDNAIKFTEHGGAYLYMSCRREDYGINLNIDMWDTGIGMSEKQLRKTYTGFYKGDSGIDRKTGGLGLGQAVVHGMVAAMGGFMSVQSVLGQGTHVHISIPQSVKEDKPVISINAGYDYQLACYFNTDKYVRPEVGEYYMSMVRHMQVDFGFKIYNSFSLEELKAVLKKYPITHVFIADWEYSMDSAYFEELGQRLFVSVFADRTFALPSDSVVHILTKPVYIMSIVNHLHMMVPGGASMPVEKKLTFVGTRALVVDDDEMNLAVAKGVLKSYGIESDTCLSGALAIEKCTLEDYDIIFMDHMMPGMNGIEAMQRIRTLRRGHYQKIPIVVLTANAVSGARAMFLQEGFDEFISKPIELTQMTRTLRKMLLKGDESNE